jgi:hypothetical protein
MWMARQVEDAGLVPRLGHPLEIKRRSSGGSPAVPAPTKPIQPAC